MKSGDSEECSTIKVKRRKLRISGDSEGDAEILESVDDAILTDNNSAADETDKGPSKDAAISRDNVDNAVLVKNTDLPLVNTRALHKEATTYELGGFEKHALLIFNQKTFEPFGLDPRHGTENDVDALTTTFMNLGFEVTPYYDMKKHMIFRELEKFSKRDFTDYGCVAVAILTHGSDNGLLWAADQPYSEIDIFNKLKVDDNKATLVSKPKIFIIQACRGGEVSSGFPVMQSDRIRKDDAKDPMSYYNLPLESDFLILHSSYPGYASHRHVVNGSWFIQTLCKNINELASTHDFESIITVVKRDVAINMEYKKNGDVKKQMPVMTSTLIRKLYLDWFWKPALEETSSQATTFGGMANGEQTTRKDINKQVRHVLRQARESLTRQEREMSALQGVQQPLQKMAGAAALAEALKALVALHAKYKQGRSSDSDSN